MKLFLNIISRYVVSHPITPHKPLQTLDNKGKSFMSTRPKGSGDISVLALTSQLWSCFLFYTSGFHSQPPCFPLFCIAQKSSQKTLDKHRLCSVPLPLPLLLVRLGVKLPSCAHYKAITQNRTLTFMSTRPKGSGDISVLVLTSQLWSSLAFISPRQ